MANITDRVRETIRTKDKRFKKANSTSKLEEANQNFNKMISDGFAKKRGNHSFSPIERSSKKLCFNIAK